MAYETILHRTVRQAKIVGGTLAERGEFPYQVALTYHDEFMCGGSILSTILILTAAHCVKYKRPSRLKVIAGNYDLSNKGSGSEQIRTARFIYMHENYVWETDVNDIALIVLGEPLQYSAYVKNISLPRANEEFMGHATVTGFGRLREKGDVSSTLRKVRLPLVPNEECQRKYRKVRMKVTDEMLCAGEFGKDACQGDSGGPGVCKRTTFDDDDSLVVCGVVSHGLGCGRQGFPGIYSKVSKYIPWIEETQRKIIARGKCRTDHFYCSSGCIPRTFLCDLETDCKEDGEDERACIYMTSCRRNQFRCTNGRCIKQEYTCDDMDDCGDRSDEDKCPTQTKTCVGDQHQCGVGGRCIPNEWKCDKEQDCDDNSDESGDECTEADSDSGSIGDIVVGNKTTTTTTPAPCEADQYFCSRDYRCIPMRWRCDGDRDCHSGIDEIGCSIDATNNVVSTTITPTRRPMPTDITTTMRTTTNAPLHTPTDASTTTTGSTTHATIDVSVSQMEPNSTMGNDTTVCSRSQFSCDNGACISNVFQCDFDDDCEDGEDERNCDLETTCSAYFWKCASGQCIYHRFRCDGEFDCVDESDEFGCDIDILNLVSRRNRRKNRRA